MAGGFKNKWTTTDQVSKYDQDMVDQAIAKMGGGYDAAKATRNAGMTTANAGFDIKGRQLDEAQRAAMQGYGLESGRLGELFGRARTDAQNARGDALFGIGQAREETGRRYDTAISDIKSGIDKDLADVRQRMARQGVLSSSFANDNQNEVVDSTYRKIADLEGQRGQEMDTLNRESYQLDRDFNNNLQRLSSDQQYQLQSLNNGLEAQLNQIANNRYASAQEKEAAEQQVVAQYFQNMYQVDSATADMIMKAATLEQQKNQYEQSKDLDIAKLGLQEQQLAQQQDQNQFRNDLAMKQFLAGREDSQFSKDMAEKEFGFNMSKYLADDAYRQQVFNQGVQEFGLNYALQKDGQMFGQDLANRKMIQDSQMFMRQQEANQANNLRDNNYKNDVLGLQKDKFQWEKDQAGSGFFDLSENGVRGSNGFNLKGLLNNVRSDIKSAYDNGGMAGLIKELPKSVAKNSGKNAGIFISNLLHKQNGDILSRKDKATYNKLKKVSPDKAEAFLGIKLDEAISSYGDSSMPNNPEQYFDTFFNDPSLEGVPLAEKAKVASDQLGGDVSDWIKLFNSKLAQETASTIAKGGKPKNQYPSPFYKAGKGVVDLTGKFLFDPLMSEYSALQYGERYDPVHKTFIPKR